MVWHLNPYVAEGGVQVRLLVLQRIRPQVLLREWILVRLLVLPSLLRPRNFRHPPAWWIWVVPG